MYVINTNVKQTPNILKALTSTKWDKQKKLIVSTFKTITRPVLEYANTVWNPIISNNKIKKFSAHELQTLGTYTTTVLPIGTQLTSQTLRLQLM